MSAESISLAESDERLLAAMTASYALVATSDAELVHDEVKRFMHLVRAQTQFADCTEAQLEAQFQKLADFLISSPDEARRVAFESIDDAAEDEGHRDLIIRAAQIAIVADGRLHQREEVMINDIRRRLGLQIDILGSKDNKLSPSRIVAARVVEEHPSLNVEWALHAGAGGMARWSGLFVASTAQAHHRGESRMATRIARPRRAGAAAFAMLTPLEAVR